MRLAVAAVTRVARPVSRLVPVATEISHRRYRSARLQPRVSSSARSCARLVAAGMGVRSATAAWCAVAGTSTASSFAAVVARILLLEPSVAIRSSGHQRADRLVVDPGQFSEPSATDPTCFERSDMLSDRTGVDV